MIFVDERRVLYMKDALDCLAQRAWTRDSVSMDDCVSGAEAIVMSVE